MCGGSALGPGAGIGRLSRGLPCFSGLDSLTPLAFLALPEFTWVATRCPTRATHQRKASELENADSPVSSPRPRTGNAGPRSGWAPGARAGLALARGALAVQASERCPPGAARSGVGGQRGTRWRWLGSTCQRREGRAGKRGSRKRVAAAAGPLERRERRRREEGARRREAGRKEGARQAGGGRAD